MEVKGSVRADLTCSNPTKQGFTYDPELVRRWLAVADTHDPEPKGLASAREAICSYLRAHGSQAEPEHIIIGSGTSELYAHLMTLLCDPGDVWLVPQPGYPLFDYIADLAGVRLQPYRMAFDGQWHVHESDVRSALDQEPRTKAIVVVSPHNPTGHVWSDAERIMLRDIALEHGLALIVDEVFLDYPLRANEPLVSAAGQPDVLTCVLSGLSKVAAFPQGKVAWMHVGGPPAMVDELVSRAELVADTFLSASTILQAGLDQILHAAPMMQGRIRERCCRNWAALKDGLADTAVTALEPTAGWCALLRLPNVRSDLAWAEWLLSEYGVATQPGYLFGMDAVSDAPFLAVSLLVLPDEFDLGVAALRGT